MNSNAHDSEQHGPMALGSLLPSSELSRKHFTSDNAVPLFAFDESIANLGLPPHTVKFKEVKPLPNADSMVAIKSGVFATKTYNTFDLKLDEIFHNFNLKKSLGKNIESDSENDQIGVGQSLKKSKAVLDFKSSSIRESFTVQPKKGFSVPSLRINKKISKYAEKFLEKGIQVKIVASKIMLHQFEISENLRLSKMSKCHERHCNLGACRCVRLTKHVRYVSFPRGPCCHFRLLHKLSIAIKALDKLKARVDAENVLRATFLKKFSD